MTTTSHLSDNLALLAHETSLLVGTASGLDDQSIREPSLCDGWTRAHVLSHLARNADGLGNLVSWAVTGTPVAMYASPQARDANIAAGSTRSAQEILTDLTGSAARFASAAPGLAGPPERAEVEMRTGRRVLGGQLPTLRLLEVVFHHVDLNAGYTFAESDPGFVRRSIANAVRRMSAGSMPPSVLLRGDSGDTWSLGEGAQEVTGTNAALLLWLARGDRAGVSSNEDLPTLPAWG
jgi:maleylpyruvate isomerase